MITSVKNSIYKDKSDTICVYLSSKMNTLEVNFNILLDLSVCHFNNTIEKMSHHHHQMKDTKDILIIQLSNNCSLLQQLITLNNISWIHDYFGIIFSSE
jgi:hypothetical protein